jgi:hypothetical protein
MSDPDAVADAAETCNLICRIGTRLSLGTHGKSHELLE